MIAALVRRAGGVVNVAFVWEVSAFAAGNAVGESVAGFEVAEAEAVVAAAAAAAVSAAESVVAADADAVAGTEIAAAAVGVRVDVAPGASRPYYYLVAWH